jgi:ribonuclease Y
VDSQIESVRGKIEQIKDIKARLDEREKEIEAGIARVAKLSPEEARDQIMQKAEKEHESDIVARLQKLHIRGEEQYDEQAKNILTSAIHRIGNTLRVDIMSSTIPLPNEDVKGKIIGKEGRNVRAFERATGVDVLIDDTPGHITLSSFDPVRREIARVALESLLSDGRVQPAKIEEVVEKARAEVGKIVTKMGEKAAY